MIDSDLTDLERAEFDQNYKSSEKFSAGVPIRAWYLDFVQSSIQRVPRLADEEIRRRIKKLIETNDADGVLDLTKEIAEACRKIEDGGGGAENYKLFTERLETAFCRVFGLQP